MAKTEIPVLIAGGGPVGLTLAVELGLRSIPCLLVERRDGTLTVPRMSQVSTRGMEFCRRWGIADKVRKAVWTNTHTLDFVYLESLTGREIARLRVPSYEERGPLDYTPEGPCHCPQIYYDPILADLAKTFPSVTLRYNTALDGFETDGDTVTARLVDTLTGEMETITARYLVGCDGAGGVVRETLGIALGGEGGIANSVNIFFRSPELCDIHDKGWARFYRAFDEDGCWGELIAIDGRELWRLTVFDHKAGAIDADAYLRKIAGRDFSCDIISVQPWERRDYLAEHFGRGNVFIAGDTVQQVSPTGGLGMHTGMCEVVNLGWKLAAAIDGWGGPGLLESYETECRPVAAYNVEVSTRSYRRIMGLPGRGEVDPLLVDAPPETVSERLASLSIPDFTKTQVIFENSPICVYDGDEPGAEEMRKGIQSSQPGSRAPHGWLAGDKALFDRFGRDFTLLRFGATDVESLVSAAADAGVPLAVLDVADNAIAALYQKRLVLVRPDGHVAWRGDHPPADAAALIDIVRGAG